MMQAADPRERSYGTPHCGTIHRQATCGGILRESKVRAIFMVIAKIFRKQPFQMSLVEDDYVI